MRCPIILLLAAFLALAQTSGAAPAPEELRAVQILEQAEKNPQDQALLAKLLAEIDREIANTPRLAANYYVRGWLLSHLGRPEEAVAAYDKATTINPKFADASHNPGVVLADLGRLDEALEHWYVASEADPTPGHPADLGAPHPEDLYGGPPSLPALWRNHARHRRH